MPTNGLAMPTNGLANGPANGLANGPTTRASFELRLKR